MSAAFIRAAGKEETQEACDAKWSRRKTALHIACDKHDHVTLQNVKSRQLRGLISPPLDCHSSVKPLNTCYTEWPFPSLLLPCSTRLSYFHLLFYIQTHTIHFLSVLPFCSHLAPPSLGCFLRVNWFSRQCWSSVWDVCDMQAVRNPITAKAFVLLMCWAS